MYFIGSYELNVPNNDIEYYHCDKKKINMHINSMFTTVNSIKTDFIIVYFPIVRKRICT